MLQCCLKNRKYINSITNIIKLFTFIFDFFVLEGKEKTPSLASGEEIRIEYKSSEPYLKNSYAPEGLIFLKSDGSHFDAGRG